MFNSGTLFRERSVNVVKIGKYAKMEISQFSSLLKIHLIAMSQALKFISAIDLESRLPTTL